MLEQKHERLLKVCYPPGSMSEKRAKPSELSYLMFYLQSHRHRIPLVANLLESKLSRQVTRQTKLGNAMVTLEIAQRLVEDCNDDISVFSPQVLQMAQAGLAQHEVNISCEACSLFQEFCKYHDGLLFTDRAYKQLFMTVVESLTDMAVRKGSESRKQNIAALRAIDALTLSPALSTDAGMAALLQCVPPLYRTARGTPLPNMRAAGSIFSGVVASTHNAKAVEPDTPPECAIAALQSMFAGSETLVTQTTTELLRCSLRDPHQDIVWTESLFSHGAQWAQVQLRFAIPKTIVRQMTKGSGSTASSNSSGRRSTAPSDNSDHSIDAGTHTLCRIFLTLLKGNVSMIGLDVRDILSDLLELQHRALLYDRDLALMLRDDIVALAQHVIYPGQASDILSDIVTRYAAIPDTKSGLTDDIACCDMQNVQAVLESSSRSEQLPLSAWTSTQSLLRRSDGVLVAYTRAFIAYLKHSHNSNSKQAAQLARQLSKVAVDSQNHTGSYIAEYYCMERLVECLGQGATVLVPTFSQLQEVGLRSEAGQSADLKVSQGTAIVSISQALLLACARVSHREDAAEAYFEAISSRVKLNQWLRGIICPSTEVPIEKAVEVARKHPPREGSSSIDPSQQIRISPEKMNLSEDERAYAAALDAPIEELTAFDQMNSYKTRARSLADSVTTSDRRILSGRTIPTMQIDAPTVSQLRRRASTNPTKQTTRVNGTSQKPHAGNLTSLLDSLTIDTSSRGRLVV